MTTSMKTISILIAMLVGCSSPVGQALTGEDPIDNVYHVKQEGRGEFYVECRDNDLAISGGCDTGPGGQLSASTMAMSPNGHNGWFCSSPGWAAAVVMCLERN